MVVQVAPVEKNVSETLCSLNFAQRVRTVELGQATRRTETAEMANMKDRLRELEVRYKKALVSVGQQGSNIDSKPSMGVFGCFLPPITF